MLALEGIALIATKRYYFGCGGGSYELMRLFQESSYSSSYCCRIVKSFEDGNSNIRDIIEVKKIS